MSRYRINRDILLSELPEKFLGNVAPAEGAFYIYADTSQISQDSVDLADRLLNEANVATTPGADFDTGTSAFIWPFGSVLQALKKKLDRPRKISRPG